MVENLTSSAPKAAAEGQPAASSRISSHAKLAMHRKLTAIYSIVGLVVGVASFMINIPLVSLGLMIIVGAVLNMAVGKFLKPSAVSGKRWWSTPLMVYVFTWLIVWTILFNMYIVKP